MRGQVGRLTSRRDRLDDFRRQKGQRQQAAQVAITDAFDGRQFGDGADAAGDQSIEATVSPPDLFQQNGIEICRCRAGSFDDELSLRAAPLDPERWLRVPVQSATV